VLRRNMMSASAKGSCWGGWKRINLKVQRRRTEKNINNKMESEKERGMQQGI
jgi:hypothetical protein